MRLRAVLGAFALAALVAAPASVAADAPHVVWRPQGTSFEPGAAYLVGFELTFACGPARRIDLAVTAPAWMSDAAVQDVDVANGRCAPVRGHAAVNVAKAVAQGTPGELVIEARDGDLVSEARLAVHVRRTDPWVSLAGGLPTIVLGAHGGSELTLTVNATYTLPRDGTVRWRAEAPPGWSVGVPAVSRIAAGEDLPTTAVVKITPPPEASGPTPVTLSVVVDALDGRTASSEPGVLRLEVTPAPEEALEPEEDRPRSMRDRDRSVPPRAPLWVLGLVFVAMVAGFYALETRDAPRGSGPAPPPGQKKP